MIFKVDEKISLFYREWAPKEGQDIVGKVVIVHGYGEHSGRYEHVAKALTDIGFKVYAFDHPGHGHSHGKKALVDDIKAFAVNIKHFVEYVKQDDEKVKVFILGHSMGGALSAIYASHFADDIAGVITTGAAIYPASRLKGIALKFIKFFALHFPQFPTVKLSTSTLSEDQAVIDNYEKDPLNYHGKVKFLTAISLSEIAEIIEEKGGNATVPILILHGAEDKLSEPAGSKFFYDKISSTDKEIKFFPEMKHEILNSPQKEKVLDTIKEWLLKRV